MATNSKTKSVSSLNKQLAGVASKAKSLGINTGKADAMVAQTTAQGSKSFKGSSYEKDYQASAIAADGLAPTAPINLPEKPKVPDIGNLVAPGNIGLQSSAEGMYTVDPATGMTTMAAPTDTLAQNQQGRLADMFAAYEGMGSGEADLAKLEKENKLAQKRQAVSNYTGQLNAIVAKSQAEQLGLEGQGRGITESIIGGQQAQINREAAIAALPVQAQLAAAQGDLEMAQQHVDKLFAIKRQDAQALFQFKSNVINSVYEFADKQEQRRFDAIKLKEDRAYQENRAQLDLANQSVANAVASGGAQPGEINKLMAMEPAQQIAFANSILGRTAASDRALDRSSKFQSIQNAQTANLIDLAKMGDPEALKKLNITPPQPGDYLKVDSPKDAQAIQKEIVTNPAYMALRKSQDSLQALNDLDTLFTETGATSGVWSPRENAQLEAKYNATILNLKEFFNLGVLNGPDEGILRGIVPEPSNSSVTKTVVTLGISSPAAKTRAGIDSMKGQIEQTIDDRYLSLRSQYGQYDPQDVPLMDDMDRIYLQQKAALNPGVKTFLDENPDITMSEALQVINTKF